MNFSRKRNNAMKGIGEKIRKIRAIKGYSQEFMASQLKMTQNNYSRIELDHGKLNLGTLAEIAKVLAVDPIDILKFDEQYVFNSISHNQTGGETKSGIFQMEALVNELKDELKYLRSENIKLLALLERKI